MATKKEEQKKVEKLAGTVEKAFYGIIFLAIFACLGVFIYRIVQNYSAKSGGHKKLNNVSAKENKPKVTPVKSTESPKPKVTPAAPGDPAQEKGIAELQAFYNSYRDTAKTGDFSKIRTFISKDHQKLFDSWDQKKIDESGKYIKGNLAVEIKFEGGLVKDDMGYLWLEGQGVKGLFDGKPLKHCLVTFRKEDGQWKILKENWADKPENLQ
ncbi:MAG: hypothetical protein LWY06_15470 [Firmicutes bacterium]|nr:hypothetical protein [Bacillota bacterium]